MAKEAGVALVANRAPKVEEDAGCTSRSARDWTIRAGSMIWTPSAGNDNCAVGFTARNSANTRYTYTAGHCSSGATLWGTGNQSIGTLSSSRNSGAVDAAYGIHSRSNTGCHGSAGGSQSWFSALPTVKSTYTPSLSVETR